jgi:CheY-like chemotaxis protein
MSVVKSPHKILVVDDEPDVEPLIRQRMRRDVRAGKYEFVFANDGVEALELLEQQTDIDMVLSDINMPKMDGLTLLAQIAKVDPNLRCVIVSAYGDMENIRTAMNRGAFDFVTKPLDFADLRVTIDRTLRRVAEWREALASRDKLVLLQNELDLASKMQQSILPTRFPEGPDFRIHGHMEPARAVGGDFFDVMPLENGRIGLAIADVSDKGVPASLFMMSTRTLLKGASVGLAEPGEVMQEVNDLLNDDNEASMFVTVLRDLRPGERGVHLRQRRTQRSAAGGRRRQLGAAAADRRNRPWRGARLPLQPALHHRRARRHPGHVHRRGHRGDKRCQGRVRSGAVARDFRVRPAGRQPGGQPGGVRCRARLRRRHAAIRRRDLSDAVQGRVRGVSGKRQPARVIRGTA